MPRRFVIERFVFVSKFQKHFKIRYREPTFSDMFAHSQDSISGRPTRAADKERQMATDAIVSSASPKRPRYRLVNPVAERFFYSGMAVLLCVCVFIGFRLSYYQAGMLRAHLPSPILDVHGAIFT